MSYPSRYSWYNQPQIDTVLQANHTKRKVSVNRKSLRGLNHTHRKVIYEQKVVKLVNESQRKQAVTEG
jgi:hypothetical protein